MMELVVVVAILGGIGLNEMVAPFAVAICLETSPEALGTLMGMGTGTTRGDVVITDGSWQYKDGLI